MHNVSPEIILEYAEKFDSREGFRGRHAKTQLAVKTGIAGLIKKHAEGAVNLLEIGGHTGWQTIAYRDAMNQNGNAEIYDWQDRRTPLVREAVGFHVVDLEADRFPAADQTFDVIIINQVLEHLKNIFLPLSEICRVLKIGGYLAISVPNICALHNLGLLLLGREPTTTALEGSHIRGFAIWSLSEFLQRNGHLKIVDLKGYGLHPFTSARMPGPIRTYCHTPVWFMIRQASAMPSWQEEREEKFTTTKFQ